MAERCAYCWYLAGNTKDHVLPRSIASVVGNYAGNIVPSCKWCNSKKSDIIWFPTISNIYGIFKNFSNKQLGDYAEYCYLNWDKIKRWHPDLTEMYEQEYNQFLILWDNGYFEDLDSHRVDPYKTIGYH